MDHVYQSSVSEIPLGAPAAPVHRFYQGDVAQPNYPLTKPQAWWFQYITESIRNVIVSSGQTPNPANLGQFALAIQRIVAGH